GRRPPGPPPGPRRQDPEGRPCRRRRGPARRGRRADRPPRPGDPRDDRDRRGGILTMAHAPRSTEVPPRRAVLPALLALVLATGTGPVPASDPDGLAARTAPAAPARKATVRFEMLATNHMVVSAKLNGKGPFDLIFDVGAPITLLTNRAALD